MPRCKEAWENESPEGGLCLFRSGIPRYRMGVQGLVPWGGRYKGGSTEGANETCGPYTDMCPIPGKGASEMAHFRKQELGPELRQAWGPGWQAGPGEEGMVGTVSGAGDPTWDWAFRSSGCPGAPDPVPLPGPRALSPHPLQHCWCPNCRCPAEPPQEGTVSFAFSIIS